MAKFYGKIGCGVMTETAPGVWEEVITEKDYKGDVIKNTRRWQSGENLNDSLVINNIISILADDFAYENCNTMKYATWLGASWKITNIEISRPRLLLTIGGLYNGN